MNARTNKQKRARSADHTKATTAQPASKKNKTAALPASASPSSSSPSAPLCKSQEAPCQNALVVVGTYHSVMAGLVLKKDKFFIKFSIKHHVGSLNRVAVSGKYMASCGVDELVFLFTNKAEQGMTPALRAKMAAAGEPVAVRLADLGSLTPPSEVTCLQFAGATTGPAAGSGASQYLLCGGADGQLLVYRTRDWSLALTLPVHERAVVDLAVHPLSSGALLVTIGADRVVAVLDLSKGRLMTKWKYTSEKPKPEVEGKSEKAADGADKAAHGSDSESDGDSDDNSSGGSTSGDDEDGADSAEHQPLADGEAPLFTKPKAQRLEEARQLKARLQKEEEAPSAATAPTRRPKVSPLILRQHREDPLQVSFSPRGTYFAVLSRFSVVVYATATMRWHAGFRYPKMMPAQELHTLHFLNEETLLVGNESGEVLAFAVPSAMLDDAAEVLPSKVHTTFPETVQEEAAALLATPIQLAVETRKKNPLRHVSRIKSICHEGKTVFTMDSNGILIAWDASATPSPVELRYRTSANCQGRVTSMSSMAL